jgi:SAM-dependent methyltransferase
MSAALSMPAAESGMIGHAQFSSATDTHTYRLQDETILLRHDPEVFPPSSFGLNFAERIDFSGCRRTADIGTGTGLLAILAARKGVADVKATDISAAALHLADGNARELNGVDAVDLRLGHFFCDLEGTFDLITANLPQEIIPPDYRTTLSPLQAKAIDGGGAGGNAILLDFLDVAARHMHWATRLYVIVNTITDYRATLRKIEAGFSPALVWQGKTATKSFVRDNIPFFRELMDAGIVSLIEDGRGQWQARQFIYRLGLKR